MNAQTPDSGDWIARWQPIETAPKDGVTAVLTWRDVGLQSVAVWTAYGWCCTDGVHLLGVRFWMPLPPAPAVLP